MRLRTSPRLKHFDYVGAYAYNLTLVTRRRTSIFTSADVVDIAVQALTEACEKHAFTVHAYCFMPDHLHFLTSGSDESSLPSFVALFKQLSSYRLKRIVVTAVWQISYYDRVLRSEDDMGALMQYIWENPVRAGLADRAIEYPYSGPRALQTEYEQA